MQPTWRRGLSYLLISLLAGLVMVSSESLWIDEGQTLHFARQPTLGDWFRALRQSVKSEAQMPLGMLVAWVGGKVLGLDEWSLRAVNLLWVGLAGVAMGLIGRELNKPALLPVFLLHPFLWCYANEARPYAVQVCASAWLLYVLVRAHRHGTLAAGEIGLFGLAAIIGFGSSLLFAFGLLGMLGGLALLCQQGRLRVSWSSRHTLGVAASLLVLVAIAAYYGDTLSRGAAGAKIWKVTPMNLAFAFYELLGFSGLGPPRNELRDLARDPSQLGRQWIPIRFLLGLGGAALVNLLVALHLWKLRKDKLVQWVLACVLIVCLSLYLAATIVGFPFWGRHLASLLPLLVCLLTCAVGYVPHGRSSARARLLLTMLMVCLGVSSLRLRFSADYRKDDYRSASRIAHTALAAGQVVWWSADPEECAAYYGLHAEMAARPESRLVFCYRPTEKDLLQWPAPDIILQSKPDIHDDHGQLRSYLARSPYRVIRQLSAFTVWGKTNSMANPPAP